MKKSCFKVYSPANGLKAQVGAKNVDGTVLAMTTQENTIKRTFDKRFAILLDLDFFKHPVYPYGLKEGLIVRLELSYSEKVFSCSGDTSETYKPSDTSLKYDVIFDELYATTISEMYTGTTLTLYTKETSIHYQTLSKKDTTWNIDVNNLSAWSLQDLLLLFLGKPDDFGNKNEEFYNRSIKKFLATINSMPQQLFAAGFQTTDIYPELKKTFYREQSNVTWEEFLKTKFGFWIDTCFSTNNTFHSRVRAMEKGSILLQIEKAPEASGSDLTCYVFSLEDDMTHLSVTNSSGIFSMRNY